MTQLIATFFKKLNMWHTDHKLMYFVPHDRLFLSKTHKKEKLSEENNNNI